jgi:hypothetical protein
MMREIVVRAVLNDPYDGAIRLLGDAQRFGFELRSMALEAKADGTASATVTFHVPTSIDVQLVAARLSRHPAVQRTEAVDADAEEVTHDPLLAAA